MTETIRVALASDVIYVFGTVNEVETTWTRVTGGDTWESVADRSANDTYRVHLLAINALGTETGFDLILYYGLLHLITDRTQADVNRVKTYTRKGITGMTQNELTEWNAGMKGAYNHTDLNRVNGALDYLVQRLYEIGCLVPGFMPQNTVWANGDIQRISQMSRYLQNIVAVTERLPLINLRYTATPQLPASIEGLTYDGANNIEKLLLLVEDTINSITACWYFSGELYGGEV